MRGQAAVEYLMTYGWALVVLVVIIGLILSTGVFSPSQFVPEQCDLGPNLKCDFAVWTNSIDDNTNINIRIYNGFSYDVGINNLALFLGSRNFVLYPTDSSTLPLAASLPIEIESGQHITVYGVIDNYQEDLGVLKKIKASLTYFSCEETTNPSCVVTTDTPLHITDGKILAKINKKE